eukprot:364173-Chlamydomonas_euryale.AAC.11
MPSGSLPVHDGVLVQANQDTRTTSSLGMENSSTRLLLRAIASAQLAGGSPETASVRDVNRSLICAAGVDRSQHQIQRIVQCNIIFFSAATNLYQNKFTYGLNASMTGIVAVRCDPAAAQRAGVRVGMPIKMTGLLTGGGVETPSSKVRI